MKRFLGKSVPVAPKRTAKRRKRSFIPGVLLLAVPFLAFTGFVIAEPSYRNSPQIAQRAVGPAVNRTLGAVTPRVDCDKVFKEAFLSKSSGYKFIDSQRIFPFIPKEIRASEDINATDANPCGPSNWNRMVIIYFIGKVLAILNWFAGALAIILTILAGVLYIAGFAKESNITTAKNILMGAYIGLIIVFLARVIIFGTIAFFSPSGTTDDSTNISDEVFKDP